MPLQKLQFAEQINAPRGAVWRALTESPFYQEWAAEFTEGAHFVGDWSAGSRVYLYDKSGKNGMFAEVQQNTPGEKLHLRHIGMVVDGREVTEQGAEKSWDTADEIFTLEDSAAGGALRLSVSTEWEEDVKDFMNDAFPRALRRLKEVAERIAAH